MKQLKGKTAFVTGGSSGIGLGLVKVLAGEGMKVAFSYRRQDHLDQAMAYFRDKPQQSVHPIKVDVTDRVGLAAAKLEIERLYGPVQVLINNAGIGILGPMAQATFSDWDWIMRVNVGGVINTVVTFLPGMIAGGQEAHIVNVSSMGGIAALGAAGLYATTKFAVVGLSESLRTDMIGRNIGVSVYCPGTVKSNIGEGDALRHEDFKDSGYGRPPPPLQGEASFMDVAMDPVVAAGHVLRGIKDNQLFIISHPEFRDVLRARHAKIEASISSEPIDAVRAESVRFILSNAIYSENA
ncbi:MAG TPA: SDR family NAD(P)-dependent oxidoreductase [Steroidobacteraceae bacterium]|nr:SDR family NAD(P)-dependent oxidoreductase [Steroidobacteraceae bacterium]